MKFKLYLLHIKNIWIYEIEKMIENWETKEYVNGVVAHIKVYKRKAIDCFVNGVCSSLGHTSNGQDKMVSTSF